MVQHIIVILKNERQNSDTKSLPFRKIHRSATTLKPLAVKVNNHDFLVAMAPIKRWNILSPLISTGCEG